MKRFKIEIQILDNKNEHDKTVIFETDSEDRVKYFIEFIEESAVFDLDNYWEHRNEYLKHMEEAPRNLGD